MVYKEPEVGDAHSRRHPSGRTSWPDCASGGVLQWPPIMPPGSSFLRALPRPVLAAGTRSVPADASDEPMACEDEDMRNPDCLELLDVHVEKFVNALLGRVHAWSNGSKSAKRLTIERRARIARGLWVTLTARLGRCGRMSRRRRSA